MTMDYLLTFIGVNKKIITEANPIIKTIINLTLYQGLTLRLITTALLLIPFYILYKKSRVLYYRYTNITIVLYSPVFLLHIKWILSYIGGNYGK